MNRLNVKIRRWRRSLNGKYLHPGYEPNYPESVSIETASVCNLRCSCCPHGILPGSMRPSGIMSVDTFHRILANIDIPFKRAYLHLHGEPFLNPNLPEIVQELTDRQVYVSLYSNCSIVDDAELDALLSSRYVTLNFSADLLGEEYYESIRVGASYSGILNNLDSVNAVFARRKKFFNIIIVMDSSFSDHVEDVVCNCETLYSRYSQLNGIILGSKFPWPRLPMTGDLAGRLGQAHQRCRYAFEGLNILWNGDASMCSFDYTGECVVGSMLENTYSQIFNGVAARKFRTLHWRHRNNELPLCKDCLLDRYFPMSVTLHRSKFLKIDYEEKKRTIESFFQFR